MNKDKNQIIEKINNISRRMRIAQKAGDLFVGIRLYKERKSIVEGLKAEGYGFVWDDKYEFVVDILGGPYEEED